MKMRKRSRKYRFGGTMAQVEATMARWKQEIEKLEKEEKRLITTGHLKNARSLRRQIDKLNEKLRVLKEVIGKQ